MEKNKQLEDYVREVDYEYMNTQYVPTKEAVEFVNFIKMVNGAKGEENKTPVMHLMMLDGLIHENDNLFVVHRGGAKTTVCHEYAYLYMAVYGKFFKFGDVSVAIYVSDTMENGVKNMREQLQYRWENSAFLQKYIPYAKFTDDRWEFENADGHKLFVKGFAAMTGVRGFKKYGQRPTWCHALGTVVTTNEGTHLVEDYSNAITKLDSGYDIEIAGLTSSERVTEDHQYWCKPELKQRTKVYNSDGSTASSTSYTREEPQWVHAKDLCMSKNKGNQTQLTHWLGEEIDYTVKYPEWSHKKWDSVSWWWLYGLWMADGFRSSNTYLGVLRIMKNLL